MLFQNNLFMEIVSTPWRRVLLISVYQNQKRFACFLFKKLSFKRNMFWPYFLSYRRQFQTPLGVPGAVLTSCCRSSPLTLASPIPLGEILWEIQEGLCKKHCKPKFSLRL